MGRRSSSFKGGYLLSMLPVLYMVQEKISTDAIKTPLRNI
ncbi:hypothetical protein IB211_02882c [Intestinimonas butyriciproducens]|uniref:Uncharacterized protein n=1 Tax=Intestinimonas butyriciproducens TaxID=1297617 RepID=A0A0S2W7H4_9FIRM|nr:hypothetical protein IB211_02882c [Intestinimonas butyriciproducens]